MTRQPRRWPGFLHPKKQDNQGGDHYKGKGVGIAGDLYNIVYDDSGMMPMIRGRWSAGGNTDGGFAFQLISLGEFQGEYWVGNNQQEKFLWDGKRVSR